MKSLFGFPVVESESVPVGDIVFGDFSAYMEWWAKTVIGGDEYVVKWPHAPKVGEVFTVTMDGETYDLVITEVSSDGTSFSTTRKAVTP